MDGGHLLSINIHDSAAEASHLVVSLQKTTTDFASVKCHRLCMYASGELINLHSAHIDGDAARRARKKEVRSTNPLEVSTAASVGASARQPLQ